MCRQTATQINQLKGRGVFTTPRALKKRPYENHIVILYFSVFLNAAIELMPHAYIGALTNLWSVKLKAYSTNVFVTHRRSTNQFNICKPRHRNPCIHHSNTNCNTVASQSCVRMVL